MVEYYCFVSRNKDNTDVANFKKRNKYYIIDGGGYDAVADMLKAFSQFVSAGQKGEMCRLYKQYNTINKDKVLKSVVCRILSDNISLSNINKVIASEMNKSKNHSTRKWLFDIDTKDINKCEEFLHDLKACFGDNVVENIVPTPNGFALIVNHGFDTRKLNEKWSGVVECKRDNALLFIGSMHNNVK